MHMKELIFALILLMQGTTLAELLCTSLDFVPWSPVLSALLPSLTSLSAACGLLLAQTEAPAQPDPPGLLQRLTERAR